MALPLSTRAVGLEESVESIVNRINRRGLRLKINASQFTQPLGRITDKANEFTKSLEASNARVIAFGASAAIIGGVGKIFEQLVVQAVKFEKVMTDINVVLNTSSKNLEKFGQELFGVAKNTSQALDVAAEAALEFSRQGLSMEETLKRTNDALILTRLTGMKAADAVKSLTAAVNGFADAGITTNQIINKMSAVDVKFAVSADDLANALARAGAVAQDAGVNFDQLIAAVTSAQQITARGGNVIGNSFKTIFTRIQRSSTLNQLQKLGIVVRDLRGNTLGAMKVLSNLAQTYDTLTASQQASTAEAVGGVFQINILKAGMKDLAKTNSLYSQALKVSSLATDQAYKKNEKLQTTMSSLAAQTSLSIQELSKNIGDLALAPGISSILEAVNSAVEGLNSLLGKDSDGLGADMAKGFISGFGKVLMGPGMVLALGIFGKLFLSAFKFAKQSLKDVLGVVTAKDRELKIQNAIVEAMQNNRHLAEQLDKFADDKVKSEQIILKVIQDQTKFLEKQKSISAGLAPGLAKLGVTGSLTLPSGSSSSTSTTASGHIPNFAKSPSPMDKVREKNAAKKGGYAAGSVRAMNMPGVGRVIYNSAEEVREIPGSRQPAIIPPSGSRAGREYKRNFQGKLGFNPYDNNSQGFIPNYATESNGLLTLDPAFATVAGGPNFRNQGLDKSFRNAISSGNPMFIKGSTAKIAGLRGSHNARIHDVLTGLEKRGINEIGRPFYVSNKGKTTRMKKLPGEKDSDFQERVKLKGVQKDHKGYFSTGGSDGDDSFPTDIIGKGLKPIEVKAGEINKHNLLLKSFRLYSDSELLHYANQFPELKEKVAFANSAHRLKGENLLNKKGILNAGSTLEETEEELLSHSVAGGFIPNFADSRNRQQKIQDVLRDPANKDVKFKGGGLGHKTIKSKHFSQKSWLESYFKKGLETDYEMLLDMGYDPTNLKKLRAHSKTGGQVNVLGKGLVPNFSAPYPAPARAAWENSKNKISRTTQELEQLENKPSRLKHTNNSDQFDEWAMSIQQKDNLRSNEQYGTMANKRLKAWFPPKLGKPYSQNLNKASMNGTLGRFKRLGVDPSKIQGVKTSALRMAGLQTLRGGKTLNIRGSNGIPTEEGKTAWGNRWGALTSELKGIYGEIDASRLTGLKIGQGNEYLDLGGLIEVKTKAEVLRAEILRKYVNTHLSKLTPPGLANNKVDRTDLGAGAVYTPIGSRLNGSGFIPNFARTPNAHFGSKVKSSQLDTARRMALEKPINVAAQNLLWKKGTPEDRKDLERLGYKGEKPWEFKWQDWNDKKSPIWEMLKMGSPQKGMPADNFRVLGQQFRYFQKQDQRRGAELNTPGDFFESYQRGRKFSELKHESANLNTRAADSVPAAFDRYRHRKEMAGVTDINGIPLPLPHGAQGMVPNFADPLREAISRELSAGIPKSRIRVDQDSSLSNRGNPLGLAVTNTRDEPNGVKQGIRRAKMQGTDPKTHGIPNYAISPSTPPQGAPPVAPAVDNSLKGFAGTLQKSSKVMEGLDMKLMGLTTATYFLEGAFGDAESGLGKMMGQVTAVVQGLSQGAQLFSMGAQVSTGLNMKTAENTKAGGKWTKAGGGKMGMGGVVGGAAKVGGAFLGILGPIGLLLGVLPPIIKAFGLFKSASEEAAEKLAKVTGNLESLDSILDLSKKGHEDGAKINKLERLGSSRSIEQGEKLLELQMERSMRNVKLNTEVAKLSTRFGDSSDIQNNLNGTYKERIKYLNELKQAELEKSGFISAEKDFAGGGVLVNGVTGGLLGKNTRKGAEGMERETMDSNQATFAARIAAYIKIKEDMTEAEEDSLKNQTLRESPELLKTTEARKTTDRVLSAMTASGVLMAPAQIFGRMGAGAERDNQWEAADAQIDKMIQGLRDVGMVEGSTADQMGLSMKAGIRTAEQNVSQGKFDVHHKDEAESVLSALRAYERVIRKKVDESRNRTQGITAVKSAEDAEIEALQEGQKLMRETNQGITKYHLIQDQKLALARKDIRLIESGLKLRAKLNESMGAIGGDDLVTANRDQAIGSTNRTARLDTQKEDRALQKLQDDRIQKAMLDKDKNPLITGNEAVFDATLGMKKHVPTALIQTSGRMLKSGIAQNAASAGSGDDQKAAAQAFAKYAISLKDRAAASDEILTREETYALAQKQIFNLKKTEQKNAFLRGMKESGLLSIQDDNMTLLTEDLKNSEGISIITKDGIEQQRKKSNRQHNITAADESLSKKTLSAGQSRLYKILLDTETQENIGKTYVDGLRSANTWAQGSAARNKLQLAALKSEEGQQQLFLKSKALADEKVIADEISLKTKVSEVQAEVARLKDSEELTELVSDQHDLAMAQLDKEALILTQKGKLYETYEKLNEAVVKQLDIERKKADQGRDFERDTHREKMKGGDYQKEKGRAMEQNIETLEGTQEALKYSVALHKSNGNTAKAAEATVALANNIKSLNEELNRGTMFWDSIRVKIAEADNRAARFAETLANTSFDAVRDGFSTMFSDLASGTKKTSSIMLEFAGSIAKKIQDKLFDHAADKITSGIFKLMGMDKFHSGGFVSHYAGGGRTEEVPAMLTSGEYVVRKKVVDRIGIKALDEMNEKGSLEELFDQPNQDKFDLLGGGDQASSQSFEGQGYNIGGLAKILKLNRGGLSDSEEAVGDIMYGAGAMGGAALAGYMNREPDNNDGAPVAPDTRRVNTTSSLDLGFKDPRLSAKYRQDDQNSQDHGKYLLDKYNYDVDKKNTSEREKAALIQSIGATVGLGVGMAIGNKIGKGVANSIVGAKLSGNGIKTTDGQRITYDSQTNQFNTVAKDGTKSSTEYTSTLTDRFRGYASPNSELGNDSKSAAIFMREQGYLVGRDGNPSFGGLTEGARGTGKLAGTKMSPRCAGGVCSAEPQSSNHSNSGGRHPPQRPYDALTDRANALSTRFSDINKKYDEKNAGGVVSNSSNVNNYNSGGKVGLRKAYGNTSSNVNNYRYGGSVFDTNDMRKKAESSSSTNDYSSVNSVSNSSNNNSIYRSSSLEEKNMGGIIGGQMSRFSSGGSVSGPAGIDKVGPVMLDNGEYVIKSNSVRNIEQSYPGLLDKLNASNFNEGGQVGSSPSPEPQSSNVTTNATSNESSSNVTVNINVGSNGSSSTEVSGGGSSDSGQQLGSKLKEAVLSVMAQEMRVGGMLRGN
jgi:TP901 family phage tail tape measure protein